MAVKMTHDYGSSFAGVLAETSEAFVAAVSEILTGANDVIGSGANKLATWSERMAQRQHLVELDNRLLDDIGMDRGEALKEADKPFWRA